jgi:hypothetical protein
MKVGGNRAARAAVRARGRPSGLRESGSHENVDKSDAAGLALRLAGS